MSVDTILSEDEVWFAKLACKRVVAHFRLVVVLAGFLSQRVRLVVVSAGFEPKGASNANDSFLAPFVSMAFCVTERDFFTGAASRFKYTLAALAFMCERVLIHCLRD